MDYDFTGWATKSNTLCSDGLTIDDRAFMHNDGKVVPLVWNHQHEQVFDVLGHALLKYVKGQGIRAYGKFNDTESGQTAKSLLRHGDVTDLSICASKLQKNASKTNLLHGDIKEVSLVLAGANPGAKIDYILKHGEISEDEGYIYHEDSTEIYLPEDPEFVEHASELENNNKKEKETMGETQKTIGEIFDTLNAEQKDAVYAIIGTLVEDEADEEDEEMRQNIFEGDVRENDDVLMHDAMTAIIGDAKRFGSMKESFIQHADTYGIDQIDYLFPDAANVTDSPIFIQRDLGWVTAFMKAVHRTPFSRIKSLFADITEEEARAKGYIKGKLKKEEVFSLLKRTTTPTTVYKKQKMDRDDQIDITDFDVVSWLKTEMRMMLDEELARAFLVGDGRLASSDDKINEGCIRPIWTDADLYTIKAPFKVAAAATSDDKAKAFIRAAIKARKDYKGSGNPTLYTTEDILTDCLLLTDEMGRDLYESAEKLAMKLRVKNIVTVPVMENLARESEGTTYALYGIIVNPVDYNVGADKGGAVNMFEDFDIDYNQQKYLIETRCSGALIRPHSAIALELDTTNHIG